MIAIHPPAMLLPPRKPPLNIAPLMGLIIRPHHPRSFLEILLHSRIVPPCVGNVKAAA